MDASEERPYLENQSLNDVASNSIRLGSLQNYPNATQSTLGRKKAGGKRKKRDAQSLKSNVNVIFKPNQF